MEIEVGQLITKAKTKRCGDGEYPVLSMTMHDGLVFQNDRFKKQIASVDQSNYQVVSRHQLVESFPIDEGVLAVQELTDEGIVSPAYKIWDVDTEKVAPVYLEYALRSPRSIEYYKSKLRGTTARRRSITDTEFCAMKINCPSLDKQEEILDILQRTKQLINCRKNELEFLDELIKARFVELFGDPVEHLDNGETVRLDTIADRITVGFVGEASNDYVDDGVPYLRTQNVRVNHIDLSGLIYVTENFHKRNEKSIIHTGDVVISRVGVNRGMAAVIPDSLEEANIANCLIVGKTSNVNPFYMNMSFGKRPQFGASVGSAQGVVNTSILKKWEVYLPTRDLQEEFYQFARQIDKSKVVKI